MSDSLRSHGMQHTRLPCPSPIPGAYTNSCPSSRWCHPTISSFVGELYNVQINEIILDSSKCNEIKICLFLGRKAVTNLDSVLKSRDITFSTKVCIVKALVFPVVRSRCESWTIKKAEHWRIDAFKLWCWRRLLKVPWTARISNQSISRGNQPWIFIGRTDAEAPIFWLPDA